MPSIKVLKPNGELIKEFELTEQDENGTWFAIDAMQEACDIEGGLIMLPHSATIISGPILLKNSVSISVGVSPEDVLFYGLRRAYELNLFEVMANLQKEAKYKELPTKQKHPPRSFANTGKSKRKKW